MNLGSSMRRRRGGPGGERRPDRMSPRAGQFLRSGGWVGIAALGVILAGAGAGYLYATQIVFPEPEVAVADFRDVPDLRSMSIAEVEAALGLKGLVVGRIDSIRHPELPSGLVFGQTPLPGQLAVEGAPVEVTVSLGPETRPVPDVSRLPAE
ncbi:MAG: PASTA domain-containing protein, partial [Gemmatimonadota bacterium]